MSKSKYNWYYDPKIIQEVFSACSPFNTVSDFKRFLKGGPKWFYDELDNSVYINSYDTLTSITSSKLNCKYDIIKIRVSDPHTNKGKSYGLRCIVLLDNRSHDAFPLHIYDKKDKKDLTQNEKNQMRTLLTLYIKSVE